MADLTLSRDGVRPRRGLPVHGCVLDTVDTIDPAVEKADQLENELHEGPSLAVSQEHDPYLTHDTLADAKWPRWSSGAATVGLRSVLSAWLPTTGTTTRTLTLYGSQPSRFSHEVRAVARVLAPS